MGVDAWAFVVAALSAGWGVFVWFMARREAKAARDDADRALMAAERSADEAARSAAAAERSAAALEEQVILAKPPDVDFRIRPLGSGQFTLRNTGQLRATNVRIPIPPNTAAVFRFLPDGVTLEKGQSADFLMVKAGGSIPATLSVACDQLDELMNVEVERE